jgi:tetratricopeptide (TPR) repeat protein
MFVRWISVFLLTAFCAGAIPRPDAKTTLRGLARMPRAEFRVSLDFDADRGFGAFRTSKDSALAIAEARAKLNKAPNDESVMLEMAGIRMESGDVTGARRDLQRAAETLRKKLDAEPGNSRARLELASALHALGRQGETEAILREAVKGAPRSVTNRVALSAFLEARGWEIAADTLNWRGRRPYAELSVAVLRREPSMETAERAKAYFQESLDAAEEAARIDEQSATAQNRLAVALASRECFAAVLRRMRAREVTGPVLETLIFSEKALPALEKAAELDPENPIRLATALLWRGLAEAAEKRIPVSELLRRSIWENLPEEERTRIEAGLTRLESFSSSSKSGAVYQALGTLRFALRGDLRQAADDLTVAAANIPDSEQVWETLSAILLRTQNFMGLAAVCESRAEARPTARNRFLVAKSYEKLGDFDRAEEELTLALGANASDFAANVGMANLLMRRSTADGVSPRVRQSLVNAERAVRGTSNGQQLVDLALAQGIYYGLTDELERSRDILKAALTYAKDHPDVTAALNAIGY